MDIGTLLTRLHLLDNSSYSSVREREKERERARDLESTHFLVCKIYSKLFFFHPATGSARLIVKWQRHLAIGNWFYCQVLVSAPRVILSVTRVGKVDCVLRQQQQHHGRLWLWGRGSGFR